MQPYFFPYLGHFALIGAVDEWIVFDVTQYTPKTWMNRNRILHPKTGWQYVSVPLSNASISIRTHEARVLNLKDAASSLLGKLTAFRKAPFYSNTVDVVNAAFARTEGDSLTALNVQTLDAVCQYLGVPFRYRIASALELEYPPDMSAGDWAPFLCEKLGATEYVNPAGGRELFDPLTFERAGVALRFAEYSEFAYATGPFEYQPHLSVIDALLWNAPETIATALRDNVQIVA